MACVYHVRMTKTNEAQSQPLAQAMATTAEQAQRDLAQGVTHAQYADALAQGQGPKETPVDLESKRLTEWWAGQAMEYMRPIHRTSTITHAQILRPVFIGGQTDQTTHSNGQPWRLSWGEMDTLKVEHRDHPGKCALVPLALAIVYCTEEP